MISRDQVQKTIFAAIDDINIMLPQDRHIQKLPDTALAGEDGGLDSLGVVNLIVAIEQKIQEQFQRTISLVSDEALSQRENPFANVQTLTEYIFKILEN